MSRQAAIFTVVVLVITVAFWVIVSGCVITMVKGDRITVVEEPK